MSARPGANVTRLRLLVPLVALGSWTVAGAAPPPGPPAEASPPAPSTAAPPATAPSTAPAGAAGQDAIAAQARAAYRRGADFYKAGRYRDAIAEFQEAERLKPSPALHFNMGQAWERLGEAPAALASYARYLRLDPKAPNREAVERSVRSLEAKLAASGLQMLHVTTAPPGAELSVDGSAAGKAPLDAPFPPGRHALSAGAPGHRTTTLDVDLPAGTSLEVNLVLEPGGEAAAGAGPLAAAPPAPPLDATTPAPEPKPVERKSWVGPIIAASVGVVAAGAGLVMGLQARSAQNALLAGGNDRQEADALVRKAQDSATTANVLYGVAGAALLTGGVLAIAF